MFDYNPADASKCWPGGDYEATLENVTEGKSKKGNPMLTVKWKVYHGAKTQLLDDWIVNPATLWKLKDIARALGMTEQFNDRSFDLTHLKGSALLVRLNVQNSEQFGEQNQIGMYKKLERALTADTSAPALEEDDEEIPF